MARTRTTRRTRLGGEDAAWFHTDTPDNFMIVTGVLELEGKVDVAALERVLDERLLRHAPFRSRVVEPRFGVGRPQWEALDYVDLETHVAVEALEDGGDDAVRRRIGEIASSPLPRDRPLWRAHVLERPGAGTAVVFRVHHAIADGFALEAVLLSLCDGVVAPIPRHPPSTSALGEAAAALRRPWRLPGVVARYGASFLRLVTAGHDADGVLKGRLGPEKRVAWTPPISFARVHDAAGRAGVTVNDLLVAVVAGALRRYAEARGAIARRPVKAMVPVNLRSPEDAIEALGNFFGLIILPLPIHLAGAARRLVQVKRAMDAIKRTPQAIVGLGILQAMGRAPRWLERFGIIFFTRKTSLVLTNVAGPTTRPTFAGAPIRRILFWVPQSGRIALGVSAISFAGDLTVGVMSDATRIPDPEAIASGIADAFETALAATPAAAPPAR